MKLIWNECSNDNSIYRYWADAAPHLRYGIRRVAVGKRQWVLFRGNTPTIHQSRSAEYLKRLAQRMADRRQSTTKET